jgi:NADPH-dependent 2,4-dienoyl-CoA reductase/sulfur reductase-like enzyme
MLIFASSSTKKWENRYKYNPAFLLFTFVPSFSPLIRTHSLFLAKFLPLSHTHKTLTLLQTTINMTGMSLPPRPAFRVVIVGAGIAGLMMGILLDKIGVSYTILERASKVRPLGKCQISFVLLVYRFL